MKKVIVFYLSCYSFYASAEISLKEEIQNISLNWTINSLVSGDLSNAGSLDAAAILFQKDVKKKEKDDPDDIATLRIYFRDKNGKLYLKKEVPQAICVDCGGAKGGHIPFEISIKKGIFILSSFSGSRESSSFITKWRYKNDNFYLIGVSERIEDSIPEGKNAISITSRDANISTLKMAEFIQYVTDSLGNPKKYSKNYSCIVNKNYQKIVIDEINNIEMPLCPK